MSRVVHAVFLLFGIIAVTSSAAVAQLLPVPGAVDPLVGSDNPPVAPSGGWAPGTFDTPEPPEVMAVRDRYARALKVTWLNTDSVIDTTTIERLDADGQWELVANWPLPGQEWSEWGLILDSGLEPDTRYCYRVRVENAQGARTTLPEHQICGYTRVDPELFFIGAYRAQLLIRVADSSDAGSTDELEIWLNSMLAGESPNGSYTILDQPPPSPDEDDLFRGREYIYDLNMDYIRDHSDITILGLSKDGSDSLGIAQLALLVNGEYVFARTYEDDPLWLGDEPITFTHEDLRSHDRWPAFAILHPNMEGENNDRMVFHREELEERLLGIIGHRINLRIPDELADEGVRAIRWPVGGGVRVTPLNSSALNVTTEFHADVNNRPDANISISFDIEPEMACFADEDTGEITSGRLIFAPKNRDVDISVDVPGIAILSPALFLAYLGAVWLAEDDLTSGEGQLASMLGVLRRQFTFVLNGVCPTVEVNQEGDVVIALPAS